MKNIILIMVVVLLPVLLSTAPAATVYLSNYGTSNFYDAMTQAVPDAGGNGTVIVDLNMTSSQRYALSTTGVDVIGSGNPAPTITNTSDYAMLIVADNVKVENIHFIASGSANASPAKSDAFQPRSTIMFPEFCIRSWPVPLFH